MRLRVEQCSSEGDMLRTGTFRRSGEQADRQTGRGQGYRHRRTDLLSQATTLRRSGGSAPLNCCYAFRGFVDSRCMCRQHGEKPLLT